MTKTLYVVEFLDQVSMFAMFDCLIAHFEVEDGNFHIDFNAGGIPTLKRYEVYI